MNKRTRYLLLGLGFVFFLLFAPVMVLYVTGLKYNLATGEFIHTGILAIRSDPGSVNVLLNGKQVRSSDGDIKFLAPGEYNLSLQKSGYQSWSKRFSVQENQVTWASPAPNNLVLFKQNSAPTKIMDGISDMALSGDNLLYLSPAGLSLTSVNDFTRVQTFSLKSPATKIQPSPNGQYFLLDTGAVFDLSNKKISDISKLVTASSTLQFSDDNNLYALQNNSVYKMDFSASKKTIVIKNAAAFSAVSGNIYYLQQTATGSSLNIQPLAGGQAQTLLNNLPTFSHAQIFVNYQKEIILLLDGSLYQAANIPVLISNNVSDSGFDQANSNLLILRNGELDFYNYSDQTLDFITRTGLPLNNFVLRADLNYAFFFKDSSLQALELDLRDHQNGYSFYQAQDPEKFILDSGGKKLYILDGGALLEQTIR